MRPDTAPNNHAAAGSAGANAADHAMELLADLDARLANFKRLHEVLASREQAAESRDAELASRERTVAEQLDQREARVAAREQDVKAKIASFDERERTLAEQQNNLQSLEHALAERQAQCAKVESTLDERESRVGAREQDVKAKIASFDERENILNEQQTRLRTLEQTLAERQAHFAEVERTLDQRDAETAERSGEAETKERWLTERERVLADRERTLEQGESQQEAVRGELQTRQADVARREQAVDERELAIVKREHATAEAERMVAELAEREKELAALSDQLNAKESEVREQSAQIERDRAAVAEQAQALAEKSADAESQGAAIWAGRTEQIQLELGEARAAKAAIATELAQAHEEIERLKAEVGRAVEGSASEAAETAAQRSRISELEQQLSQASEAMAQAARRLEQSRSEAAMQKDEAERALEAATQTHRTALGEREDELARRDAAVQRLNEEVETLRRELSEARERTGGEASTGSIDDDVEKRDQAIALLRDRLERIQGENTAFARRLREAEERAQQAEAAAKRAAERATEASHVSEEQPSPTDSVLHAMQRRHHRLRTYKALLQGQARKIVAAQSALQKRHADCEQILSHRQRLAQAAAEVSRREKRTVAAKARTGAAAALLCVVASLGIVLVLSWEATKRMWPGTYVARATIEADARGKRGSADALAQWQKDHESLLTDPRLMEFAAQRFARRGLTALGSATELRARLQRDLYAQSTEPGVMTIELRGEGGERTAMELDTLITSFKSLADMSRDERAGSMGVNITQGAAPAQEPLSDKRLEYAGMVFGAGAGGTLLLGCFMWWRMSRTKRSYETSQAVEAALEQVDWAALEKSFKKPAEPEKSQRIAA